MTTRWTEELRTVEMTVCREMGSTAEIDFDVECLSKSLRLRIAMTRKSCTDLCAPANLQSPISNLHLIFALSRGFTQACPLMVPRKTSPGATGGGQIAHVASGEQGEGGGAGCVCVLVAAVVLVWQHMLGSSRVPSSAPVLDPAAAPRRPPGGRWASNVQCRCRVVSSAA